MNVLAIVCLCLFGTGYTGQQKEFNVFSEEIELDYSELGHSELGYSDLVLGCNCGKGKGKGEK